MLKPADAKHAVKRVQAFISIGKKGPLPDAVKYGRNCGMSDIGTKVVPLAEAGVGKDVLESIVRTFPACGRELGL